MIRSLHSIVFSIVIIGSAIQFGDYIVVRYFVPLLSLMFGIFLFFYYSKVRFNRLVKKVFYVHLLSLIALILLSVIGYSENREIIFDIVKLFLAFGFSFLILYSILYASDKAIIWGMKLTSLVVLIVFSLDALVRFNGFEYSRLLANFYLYKMDSPFFTDTNALALYGLFYFSGLFYFYNYFYIEKSWFFRLNLFLISLFILLTLSRASVVALLSILSFHWFFTRCITLKVLLLISSVLLAILIFPYIIEVVAVDGSGSTKLVVYQNFWNMFWVNDLRGALFGYGINAGNYAYSYEEGSYSHALFPMVTGHFGLIGLIVYLSFFGYLIWLSIGHSLYVFIPAFVAGFSYLHPFLETFFLINALVAGIYLRSKLH